MCDARSLPLLSKAGYYVIIQNGRIQSKKQPYFANEIARKIDFNSQTNLEAPGPGAYINSNEQNRELPYVETRKKIQKYTLKVIHEPKEKEDLSEIGPGAYNVGYDKVKPRIKGIPEWKKEANEERIIRKITDNESPRLTGVITEILKEISKEEAEKSDEKLVNQFPQKQLSPFASKVPRFAYQRKSTKSLTSQDTSSVIRIEKTEDGHTKAFLEKSLQRKSTNVFFDFLMFGKELPGPGQYYNPEATQQPKKSYAFSKNARFKSVQIESEVGPGAYNAQPESMFLQNRGIPFPTEKRESYFMKNEDSPGPGKYYPPTDVFFLDILNKV